MSLKKFIYSKKIWFSYYLKYKNALFLFIRIYRMESRAVLRQSNISNKKIDLFFLSYRIRIFIGDWLFNSAMSLIFVRYYKNKTNLVLIAVNALNKYIVYFSNSRKFIKIIEILKKFFNFLEWQRNMFFNY